MWIVVAVTIPTRGNLFSDPGDNSQPEAVDAAATRTEPFPASATATSWLSPKNPPFGLIKSHFPT